MPLEVWTARVSSRDPDRFDVTRKSGVGDGLAFAPSWAILAPALGEMRKATRLREIADQLSGVEREVHRNGTIQSAMDIERRAWAAYVHAYTDEMRASYRVRRSAWEKLLARPRVVLVCYCVDSARCHRTVLAGILGKLGADVRGELPATRKTE